jgi:hypothetical protein
MKKFISILVVLSILLTGCSFTKSNSDSIKLSDATYTLEIPVADGKVFTIEVPTDLQIMATDNNVYFKFNNDIVMYATHNTESSSEVTKYAVSRQVEERYIFARCDGAVNRLKETFGNGIIKDCDVKLYIETELKEFPEYMDMSDDMILYDNNLYMPDGCEENTVNIYTSELLCDGESWLESWIMDGTYDDIKDTLATYCITNSGSDKINYWYKDDNIVIMYSGDNIVAAKKLRYNEWYVYSGSAMYEDYILTGVDKVHSSI